MNGARHTTAERIAAIERSCDILPQSSSKKARKILLQYPITAPQFVALQWLADKGDMTTGDLSQTIRLAISTTTDIVDRLEKNELVKRVRDSEGSAYCTGAYPGKGES